MLLSETRAGDRLASADLLIRARQRFSKEPIRTLDALHVASALVAKAAVPDLAVLSLDDNVRSNARALGFNLEPLGDDQPKSPAR